MTVLLQLADPTGRPQRTSSRAEGRGGKAPLDVNLSWPCVATDPPGGGTGGRRFAGVLCHGVLMYLEEPEPMTRALCRRVEPGGIVSVMALNAATLAIRPALERRWTEALAAFDATEEVGVLGTPTRGDT